MTQAIVNFKDGSKSLVRVNQSYARGMVQVLLIYNVEQFNEIVKELTV